MDLSNIEREERIAREEQIDFNRSLLKIEGLLGVPAGIFGTILAAIDPIDLCSRVQGNYGQVITGLAVTAGSAGIYYLADRYMRNPNDPRTSF